MSVYLVTIPTYVIMFLCVIGSLQNKNISTVGGDIIR